MNKKALKESSFVVTAILFGIISAFFVTQGFKEGVVMAKREVINIFEASVVKAEKMSSDVLVAEKIENPIVENIIPSLQKNVGLLMFRGVPERNWYGEGTVPKDPKIDWRYPDKPMCSLSSVYNETKEWCGNGWTGEPVVWERSDGITEIIFGAYDRQIHFVNAETGKDTRPPFPTGDIIKGSPTLDPDGYPLLYFGSRDNYLRVISLEENTPKELWKMSSHDDEGIWNDDWDSNPVMVDDVLYEGCENGYFYAIKMNRKIDENGKVSVDPVLIFKYASYTDELIQKTDKMQSIESSTLVTHGRAYIANSAGHILGFDISNIEFGIAPVVFDYWVGDDTDATLVTDSSGMLYVSTELERFNDRSYELGQLIKLNPYALDPYVWGIPIVGKTKETVAGIWATPAIYKNYLYVPTHNGELLAVDTISGKVIWKDDIGFHAWGSPSVVDGTLVVPSCAYGSVRAYDLANPMHPEIIWDIPAGTGCIESTPAVWKGGIYFGNRDGYFYKIGEK